ncbi:MAG TPA: hypothetical protein DCO75_13470 [Fibrobacteres bacterium]|jgi:hypothetical protein|nr:hypothetical protein [Fibrobacterota bacterium]
MKTKNKTRIELCFNPLFGKTFLVLSRENETPIATLADEVSEYLSKHENQFQPLNILQKENKQC